MPRFRVSTLLLVTVIVALVIGWDIDRSRLMEQACNSEKQAAAATNNAEILQQRLERVLAQLVREVETNKNQ